jgi:IS1 family transposase
LLPLSETLVKPDTTKTEDTILELDELWSFIQTKALQAWIWIALCRKTRQVVAYALGDRSEDTCRELWNRIPEDDQKGYCHTDFWRAYVRRFGVSKTLYKIDRAACYAIAERHTAYRRKLREKRLQGYREEIRRIALYLQAEHVALTRRHIARYLPQPAILRDPHVRTLLTEVCCEVEEKRETFHGKETGAFGEQDTQG